MEPRLLIAYALMAALAAIFIGAYLYATRARRKVNRGRRDYKKQRRLEQAEEQRLAQKSAA